MPGKRESNDLWVFEGYDTHTRVRTHARAHTHTHAHMRSRTHTRARTHARTHAQWHSVFACQSQIGLQSIIGTDLVSEFFHLIQIQFPSHLASVDVDFPCFHEQFLDLYFGYRRTSMPMTPMIQQNSLRIGLSYTTVETMHLIPLTL